MTPPPRKSVRYSRPSSGWNCAEVKALVSSVKTSRAVDPDDQSVRRLSPTPLGRAVIAQLMATRPEMGADVLEGLDLAELESLERGLRAINRELQRVTADPRGADSDAAG